jgi:hypothetical protein
MPNKKPKTSMTIEPMPSAPKSFTDRNLEQGYGAGGANNYSTGNAKKGGSISPELNATPQMSKGFGHKGITSLKTGGTAKYTGPHLLHKGEKVMPNDLYKKADDKTPFKGLVTMSPQSSGDPQQDVISMKASDVGRAHQVAVDAGGFTKHGANGNMVHSKSSAIAPHDKGR